MGILKYFSLGEYRLGFVADLIIDTSKHRKVARDALVGTAFRGWDDLAILSLSDDWVLSANSTNHVIHHASTPAKYDRAIKWMIMRMLLDRMVWFFDKYPEMDYLDALRWAVVSAHYAEVNKVFLPVPEDAVDVGQVMNVDFSSESDPIEDYVLDIAQDAARQQP